MADTVKSVEKPYKYRIDLPEFPEFDQITVGTLLRIDRKTTNVSGFVFDAYRTATGVVLYVILFSPAPVEVVVRAARRMHEEAMVSILPHEFDMQALIYDVSFAAESNEFFAQWLEMNYRDSQAEMDSILNEE